MLRNQVLAAACTLFLLAAMLMPRQASGQADSVDVEIIWQMELDDDIKHRIGDDDILEPNVGIDLSVPEGQNPIRAIATWGSVYIFDEQGNVKRQVALKRDPVPNDLERRTYINERASIAPNGQFYRILTSESDGYNAIRTNLRVFDIEGNLKFELDVKDLASKGLEGIAGPRFSPDGTYIVLFLDVFHEEQGPPFISFLDIDGNVRKHISFHNSDFSPLVVRFLDHGQKVLVKGFKTDIRIIYDPWGNELERVKAVKDQAREAERTLAVSFKQKVAAKLPEQPASKAVKRNTRRRRDSIKFHREKGLGVYSRGTTLCLFKQKGIGRRGGENEQ